MLSSPNQSSHSAPRAGGGVLPIVVNRTVGADIERFEAPIRVASDLDLHCGPAERCRTVPYAAGICLPIAVNPGIHGDIKHLEPTVRVERSRELHGGAGNR